MTELSLDDPEGMFDLGTHQGDDPVDFLVDGVELAALGRLAHDAPDLASLLKTASRAVLTKLFSAQTDFSASWSSSSQTRLSCSFAVVASRLWTMPLSGSTPICAFMPKYQSIPFFVEDIFGLVPWPCSWSKTPDR